jgi:hypothetical protein
MFKFEEKNKKNKGSRVSGGCFLSSFLNSKKDI